MKTKSVNFVLIILMILMSFSLAACKQDNDKGLQDNDKKPQTDGVLTEIKVTKKPDKLEYVIGEAFNPAGMIVTAYYDDDSSAPLESGSYSISGFSSITEGPKTITVTVIVDGEIFSDHFDITILPPVGTPITGTWEELTIPAKTTALRYTRLKEKDNVLHVAPAARGYDWTVLSYSLNEYQGKTVTVTVSVDVWFDTAAKAAWQINTAGYPVIAGSTSADQITGQWVTLAGSESIVIPAEGALLYLSGQQLGGSEAYFANFSVIIAEEGEPGSGLSLIKNTLTLTIGAKEKLGYTIAAEVPVKSVTWTSSNSVVVSVSGDGVVTAVNFSTGGSNTFTSGAATGSAVITVKTTDDAYSDTIEVTATTAAQVDILTLPPLKDLFADYFLIGNIFRGSTEISGTGAAATISNTQLTRHFNALTAENHMKPSYLVTGHNNGTFTWSTTNQTTADNFVDAANKANMKVIGHTLLWHSQNPNWVWQQIATNGNGKNPAGTGTNPGSGVAIADKAAALTVMRGYISAVAGRYAGQIYSWDVLNEIFPDNASSSADWKDAMRKGASGEGQDANPWYIAIGSDFVYEGFLAARKADPNAILYYNDYNTDSVNRARLIHDMIKEVNDKYLSGTDKPAGEAPGRLLIEGIGMQEHHNFSVTATAVKNSINKFRTLNVAGRDAIRLSVSELDIIAYDQYSGLTNAGGAGANQNHNSLSTNQQLLTQATRYSEYMKIYIENADIIERVSLWGVTDNFSWRSRGLPLLFDHAGKAKPSYYSFVGVLE